MDTGEIVNLDPHLRMIKGLGEKVEDSYIVKLKVEHIATALTDDRIYRIDEINSSKSEKNLYLVETKDDYVYVVTEDELVNMWI